MNHRAQPSGDDGAGNLALRPPGPIVPLFDKRRIDVAFNRFPLKHGWDALSLGRLFARRDLTARQKYSCLKFYFTGQGIPNLFASLTRSGSHWSILGIALALDLAAGGDGKYEHFLGGWYPATGFRYLKLDWRAPSGELALGRPSVDPVLFHTHHPYYRTRSACLKQMNIAIVLRSITESMESKYYKLSGVPDSPTFEDDENFAWEKLVDDAIEFYNSWGDVIRWHPSCRVYKYEELLADPVGVHKQMTDFFGLDIPTSCLEEAFGSITKDKMKLKFEAAGIEAQTNVSYRSEDSDIPAHRRDLIRKKIADKLVFDFGYDFNGADQPK
jgi:sulfotransferase family protein